MKNSKKDIVAVSAVMAETKSKSMWTNRPETGMTGIVRTNEPEDARQGPSGAEIDALTELVGKVPTPDDVVEFCREKGIDERKAFGFLGSIESIHLHSLFHHRYMMSIPASAILEDGPIQGIDEAIIRRIFGYMCLSFVPYECGYISLDEYEWIRPRLKRTMVAGVSEIMRRLVSRMRDAVKAVYQVQDHIEGYPDDIFNEPSASEIIDALIDGRYFDDPDEADVRLYLETKKGEYDSIPCKMVQAEAERFANDPIAVRGVDSRQTYIEAQAGGIVILNDNKPSQEPEDEIVMTGIAKAFDRWFPGAYDEILTYIVRHYELPSGCGQLAYNGNGNDAKRFWQNVGMKPYQFNRCFRKIGEPEKKYQSNSGNAGQLDYDAERGIYKGIYEPLATFGLLKEIESRRRAKIKSK